jgi:hypothetical protein
MSHSFFFFWSSIVIAFISGLLQPYSMRLHDTSEWVGRALVPADMATVYPRGLIDPITAGWPSTYYLLVSILPYISGTIGFFYAWWWALVTFFIAIVVMIIAERTTIASNQLIRYIGILATHAMRRAADYKVKNDFVRGDAAEDLAKQLAELMTIYFNSNVVVPNHKQARSAPFGDRYYLLDLNK